MKLNDLPRNIRSEILPQHTGRLIYRCLDCGREFGIEELLYVCPDCGQVLLIYDLNFNRLTKIPGTEWRRIFDYRKLLNIPALKGIYRYHEFIGPVIPLDAVVYLGEGHTPVVEANDFLKEKVGLRFYFKNDGQNPRYTIDSSGIMGPRNS